MLLEILLLLEFCNTYNLSPYATTVSFYEPPQETASGIYFNPENYTCASPVLPLGTILTLQVERRVVGCIVTDRGPYAMDNEGKAIRPLKPHPVRKLDLSRRVFRELFDNTEQGTGNVRILKIQLPEGLGR